MTSGGGVIRSLLLGAGAYLPEKVLTNADLAAQVDTDDAWITARTGIRQRHIAAEGECTSDLATAAARRALEAAGRDARDIDLVVLATATPDYTFPSSATTVQANLGIRRGAAFDIQAVCSGFIYALATADNFLKAGQHKRALVIGAETFSRILDWNDRTTCVLFGDGAGAVVLEAGTGEGTSADRGILTSHLHADGRYRDLLYVDGGPSKTKTVGHLRMTGKEVFRHAVVNLADAVGEALEATGLAPADIDWIVPHQANLRIIEGTAKKLGIDNSRVVITVDHHGNTSAASVPLALTEAWADGRIQPGNLVLLEAMGGGFTWGSCLVRI
ncbi:beta-ketoacyl-ACP synthase III [Zavarzinia compransoris]|uniref:Beta-ketoacyl-[acyl-carrier-protein] synthase III n=1 Tax=Zavarzinia compransoris TaxID=1264899 RepID=A0A317EAZ4_9PROT|nr:beta-ketoacyl-ACP synthase III [Zavarzinia compransoris]PWR23722.1 3-oxoacyl-ACP synthase [Zavarzinia compransoris]TDP47947.1 3-oxoacyl-[acyl-carrier-protein] synthase III [Zavarzinia compransoris]